MPISRCDRICFDSIRRKGGKHLRNLLSFPRGTGLLQLKLHLQLLGISREAFPVATFTLQDKAEHRCVKGQHRSLQMFRNVKTLDPNAAEMPTQCADLPPSDGSSTDDYCCPTTMIVSVMTARRRCKDSFMRDDRQITTPGRSVIIWRRAQPASGFCKSFVPSNMYVPFSYLARRLHLACWQPK